MLPHHPLTARLDPLLTQQEPTGHHSHRLLYCRSISSHLPEEGSEAALSTYCEELGIDWLDRTSRENSSEVKAFKHRIAPLPIDKAIDCRDLQRGNSVQMQMFGIPNQNLPASRFASWRSSLPVEIHKIEQLGQKVAALRFATPSPVSVGAAIVANEQTVYEDVRYMIDSGFDSIEIVQAPQFNLKPENYLEFADAEQCVAKALKAKQDSRSPKCSLWLTTNCVQPIEFVRWLKQGIDAISVDAFLASKSPINQPARDTLAGIRVQSVHGPTDHSWMRRALQELQSYLIDAVRFYN